MNNSITPDYYNKHSYTKTVEKEFSLSDVLRRMHFNEANIIKYIVRHNEKNHDEDLKKARQYIRLDRMAEENIRNDICMCLDPIDIPKAIGEFVLNSLSQEEKDRLDHNGADLWFALVLWNYGLQAYEYSFINLCRQMVDHQLMILLGIEMKIKHYDESETNAECARTFKEYFKVLNTERYRFFEFIKKCIEDCNLSAKQLYELKFMNYVLGKWEIQRQDD